MHQYAYHRVNAPPLEWRSVADGIVGAVSLSSAGGSVYGVWRSQIGRPRDELSVITYWAAGITADAAETAVMANVGSVTRVSTELMSPTLRPTDANPPRRQGNYAFRWMSTPAENWDELLALCADAWPGSESAYDSQVIGLWRMSEERTSGAPDEASGVGVSTGIRSLLFTRRPDLAMWERSKLPRGPAEAKVRETLSRRYDLCDWTAVCTTTLLTADDAEDTARWT